MPIAILGTGRSGTSMVTRMLNLCGLYLGEHDKLQYADSNPDMNPAGYWEHPEIHAFMDRLFVHLGGTWENPPLLAPGWECAPALSPFYDEAKALVARLFGGHEEWGWKLPKATVTVAFWQRVVPDLKFIVCIRNPLDFALSLGKHTKVSRTHLFAMWQYYNYSILSATKPESRQVTFYEDYFPCYQTALLPLLDFVGLPRPTPQGDTDRRLRDFYDPALKHHASTLADVLADDNVSYVTQQLYLELLLGDACARDLPMLRFCDMLLPLLQRTLIGESHLDGSDVVRISRRHGVRHTLTTLCAKQRWHHPFFQDLWSSLRLPPRKSWVQRV